MKRSQLPMLLVAALASIVLLLACQPASNESKDQSTSDTEPATSIATAVAPTNTPEPSLPPTELPTEIPTEEPTDEAASQQADEIADTPTPLPTETPQPTATPTEEPAIIRTYNIDQDRSEVRFYIDEMLFGQPNTVVGRTNLVSGQITVDLKRPAEAQVGTIEVDARDLTTDNSFRNRAIRGTILDSSSDEFRYITFMPTGLDGVGPDPAEVGQQVTFDITGDLRIRDISNPVTYVVTATVVSETELSGFGVVTVLREDYDLQIPSVTGVAQVSEEVRLEIDFVAVAEP